MNDYSLEKKKKEIEQIDKKTKKGAEKVPAKQYKLRIYSNEEIEEILKNYLEITNRAEWNNLRPNTKICYYLKQEDEDLDLFRFGGFINASFSDKDEKKFYISLRGNVRKALKTNVQWTLDLDKVSRLFIQMSPEYHYILGLIENVQKENSELRDEVNQAMDTITMHLKQMKKRIRNLEQMSGLETSTNISGATR